MEGIIVLKQLPVIEERLAALSEKIKADIEAVVSLEVTDESVKSVKSLRARLNADFMALEDQRKYVKNKVLEPYEAFEDIYRQYVTDPFREGLAAIDSRVGEIEGIQKRQKHDAVKEYYDELCASYGVDFVPMERWNPKIGLSTTLKSLKEQASRYVSGIVDALEAIRDMEHSDEILVEYRQSLSLPDALRTVKNRHAAIEEQKRKQEEADARKQAEKEAVAKVDAALPQPTIESLSPPLEVKTIVSCRFFSTTTGEVYPREYSYRCGFPVEVGQKVEVETQKGTGKAVITAVGIDPASLTFDLSLIKNVVGIIGEETHGEKDPDELLEVVFRMAGPRHAIKSVGRLLKENGYTVEVLSVKGAGDGK